MVNIYKLAITVILLNSLMWGGMTLYTSPEDNTNNILQTIIGEIHEEEQQFEGTEVINTEQSGIMETVGNVFDWGMIMFRIIFQSINPFSISTTHAQNTIETTIIIGMNLIRALLTVILIIKGYNVYKNKDTR